MRENRDLSVSQCFKGKNILITGGTGFIGNVLIEKLLRTVPDIGNIYLFMRHKKGKSPQERIETIFRDQLFEKLECSFIEKLIAVEGDIFQRELGLSEQDRNAVIENVDVIFHIAASVRFDDSLTTAIITNIRFTRDIVELGLKAKHLKAFVHVSTAYCQFDKNVVEEKLYNAHGDWRDAIQIAKKETYTYTKSLGEHVVNDLCRGKIPAAIIRPTMVTNIYSDPLPGWTDNLNGPLGIFYALSLGVIRVIFGSTETILDLIPADVTVNILIISAFYLVESKDAREVAVYNNSSNNYYTSSLGKQRTAVNSMFKKSPPNDMIWYPSRYATITKCKYNYFIRFILSQMVLALAIDALLLLTKSKPKLFRTQKKIYIASIVLAPFICNTWKFENGRTMKLESILTSKDKGIFGFENTLIDMKTGYIDYYAKVISMIQTCVFKYKIDLEENRKVLWRLWLLDFIFKALLYTFLVWILLKSNIITGLFNRSGHYFILL